MSQIIEGEITEDDYDRVCNLFVFVKPDPDNLPYQEGRGTRSRADQDCLLGQALQRMGYKPHELQLGAKYHMIRGQQFKADIETHRAIERWYLKDEGPRELPLSFTLIPVTKGN